MLLQDLQKKKLIRPPEWLADNCHYLTIMGSVAYGVSSDTSDMDLYGFCIPKKEIIFPHLAGKIIGFDEIQGFDQWQQHHVIDPEALAGHGRSYDLSVYNIVKYFSLLADNNPNIIDSLFTPVNCVLHCTQIGNLLRDNRHAFLHKGCWHRFKGYAYSQVKKIETKHAEGKRAELREQFGFDVKFAYHVVRLINEVEQILAEGDLDLQRNNEELKAIRRGDWTQEQVVDFFVSKSKSLEVLYNESKLPYKPDMNKLRALLFQCLEIHFGNLDKCVVKLSNSDEILQEIKAILIKNNI